MFLMIFFKYIEELLSEAKTKWPTELLFQVDHYAFCYTGPFDSHIRSLFYFELL